MKQRRIKTYLKVFVNLGMMLAIILGCIFILPRIIVYFMPFVIGWIIAMIASPLVRFFEKTLKIKRKASSAVVIIAVIALVILLGYLIGAWLIEQGQHFVDDLPLLLASLKGELADVGQKLSGLYAYLPKEVQSSLTGMAAGLQQYAGNFVETASEPTIEVLSRFAQSLPSIIISVIMCLLFTYFYVADRDYVRNLLVKILPQSIIDRFDMIKRSFSRAVGGYFKAQFKIEFWMYFLLAIGFSILNVKYAFIIAIGVAFLDLLPFFGTGTVLLPWAAIAFISGDYTMVIGLLIMWGVGQLARQIIQPKIVGDSVGVPPIPTLFLLYIGYKVGSVVGMILAVPLGLVVWNMYKAGFFETTKNSVKILLNGFNRLRKLEPEDLEK